MKNTSKTSIYKRKIKKLEDAKLKLHYNKGITLVALVVTIVVLLILAGITLNYTIGNNGIIKEAQRTKNEVIDKTTNAEQNSQNLIAEIAGEERIDGVNKQRLYISTDLSCSDITISGFTLNIGVTYSEYELSKIDWFYKLSSADSYSSITDTYTNSSSSTAISVNETHTFSNLTGGTYSVYAIVYDAAGHYQKSSTILTGVIQVGSTITYSPSGSYTWQAQYYVSDDSYSDVQLNASGDYAITSWKVLAIDGTNLTLVPSTTTAGTVYLGQAQGYNNAVKLLNDACSALYGNSSKGITARSINIDDIESYLSDSGKATIASYNNGNATYTKQTSSAYLKSNSYYPIIYELEKQSVINGTEATNGLGLSEQISLISRVQTTNLGKATTISATNGYLQASTSIQPYQTYYGLSSDSTYYQSLPINSATTTNNTYYDLLMPKGDETWYWVASRCIYTFMYDCDYGIRFVNGSKLHAVWMFDTALNTTGENTLSLFPMVSLNISLLNIDSSGNFIVQ